MLPESNDSPVREAPTTTSARQRGASQVQTESFLSKHGGCAGLLLIVGVLIYWLGPSAPDKEVVFVKQMEYVESSGELAPIYSIYYEWDGVRQEEPWWAVARMFQEDDPLSGRLVVMYLGLSQTKEEMRRNTREFDEDWLRELLSSDSSQPQRTRWQTLSYWLGFRIIYRDEYNAFASVLHDARKQDG